MTHSTDVTPRYEDTNHTDKVIPKTRSKRMNILSVSTSVRHPELYQVWYMWNVWWSVGPSVTSPSSL